ncbi:hypothetical protein ACIPSE_15205 [Streptomyces sp. NPDC090106]|uniref:hypothetical protein n=1 Tax=Streptomyces sp. NPDC090106 TaxID=3365946 RepID=UPI0038116410
MFLPGPRLPRLPLWSALAPAAALGLTVLLPPAAVARTAAVPATAAASAPASDGIPAQDKEDAVKGLAIGAAVAAAGASVVAVRVLRRRRPATRTR